MGPGKDADVRRQEGFLWGGTIGALGGGLLAALLLDASWVAPLAVLSGAAAAIWSWLVVKG